MVLVAVVDAGVRVGGCASLPLSMLTVGMNVVNVDGTAGKGVSDGVCTGCLPVMLSMSLLMARGAGPVIDIVIDDWG